MPRDARLGLVVGVGLVIAFAVLSFRKDPNPQAAAGNVQTPPSSTGGVFRAQASALPGVPSSGRSHTVLEGETLFSLAVRYYGDPAQSSFLYHANQDRIRARTVCQSARSCSFRSCLRNWPRYISASERAAGISAPLALRNPVRREERSRQGESGKRHSSRYYDTDKQHVQPGAARGRRFAFGSC